MERYQLLMIKIVNIKYYSSVLLKNNLIRLG